MASRLELQTALEAIPGVVKVYFRKPENIKMQYPAIVYKKIDAKTLHASNGLFNKRNRYQVTTISYDPDNTIGDVLLTDFLAKFVRAYESNDLNHEVYELYF